jgi:hypothetical protein
MYAEEFATRRLKHFGGIPDPSGHVLERRRSEDSGVYGVVSSPER